MCCTFVFKEQKLAQSWNLPVVNVPYNSALKIQLLDTTEGYACFPSYASSLEVGEVLWWSFRSVPCWGHASCKYAELTNEVRSSRLNRTEFGAPCLGMALMPTAFTDSIIRSTEELLPSFSDKKNLEEITNDFIYKTVIAAQTLFTGHNLPTLEVDDRCWNLNKYYNGAKAKKHYVWLSSTLHSLYDDIFM